MSLHNEIMNLPTKHDNRDGSIAYKTGHRDARHASAELSLKYERYIERLEELADELHDSLISGVVDLNVIKKECGL
jgi:hypothetical protein